jgi:hypothetical protein
MIEKNYYFNLVIADDEPDVAITIKQKILNQKGIDFSRLLIWHIKDIQSKKYVPDTQYTRRQQSNHRPPNYDKIKKPPPEPFYKLLYPQNRQYEWTDDIMLSCNLLILDRGMECYGWCKENSKNIHGGDKFLEWLLSDDVQAKYEDKIKPCSIIVNTQHFSDKGTATDVIDRIDSFVDQGVIRGYNIQKFRKIDSSVSIVDRFNSLYNSFIRNYIETNYLQVKYATFHDKPVLILGESGTGKQKIAEDIHNMWKKKVKSELSSEAKEEFEPLMITINCGGLSEDAAKSLLFGYVKGSYTGATHHELGSILSACGIQIDTSFKVNDRKVNTREYQEYIQACSLSTNKNKTYVKNLLSKSSLNEMDLEFSTFSDYPMGTLFLDEFGELPEGVQTSLLRFIQESEIQPFGYPGIIRNVQLRIIAATSDPQVAEMVGMKLHGRLLEKKKYIREDLINRLKFQVIKVKAIDEYNLKNEIDILLNKYSESKKIWTKEALEYLHKEIKQVLNKQKKPIKNEIILFGHRREISNLLEKIDIYMRNIKFFGISNKNRVTKDVVKMFWKPREISPFEIDSSISSQVKSSDPDVWTCPITKTEIKREDYVNACTKYDEILSTKPIKPSEVINPKNYKVSDIIFLYLVFFRLHDVNGKNDIKLVIDCSDTSTLSSPSSTIGRNLKKIVKERLSFIDQKDSIRKIGLANFKEYGEYLDSKYK